MSDADVTTLRVTAGGRRRDYPVFVGRGLLAGLGDRLSRRVPAHRYAVISDETVAALHGQRALRAISDAGFDARLFTFPAGEIHKTREEWRRLTDALLDDGFGRDAVVVALGGGVTGDLAGFVAATYMRGIPVVQVPTSLVGMIDASVGGKTGVDVARGKNLVGAFHPPAFVLADPELVSTLPREERSQGLAEAVKHGAILDAEYLGEIEASVADLLDADVEALDDVVARSVELKAGVVGRDEREGGLRKILNFGHTLGHALEAAAAYELPHGSAVAVGMVLEARLGEALGVTGKGTSDVLERVLGALELPVRPPRELDAGRVLGFVGADKKTRAGVPRYVLLDEIGRVAADDGWARRVPEERVSAVLRAAFAAPDRDGPTSR